MAWKNLKAPHDFMNVEYIHPLMQRQVCAIVDYAKTNPDIEYVIIFGSSVTHLCTQGSDLDIFICGALDPKTHIPMDGDTEYDIIYAETILPGEPLLDEIREKGVPVYVARAREACGSRPAIS